MFLQLNLNWMVIKLKQNAVFDNRKVKITKKIECPLLPFQILGFKL